MTCDLCRKTPEIAEGVVVVTIGDCTQRYCGTPRAGSDTSCWQEAIRGWYWALEAANKVSGRDSDRSRPRLALARGEIVVR